MPPKPFDVVVSPDGDPEITGMGRDLSPDELAERKAIIAKCGHVARRLIRNERLTGKVLEFALGLVDENRKSAADELLNGIADKLAAGQQLSEYERHIMLDVVLLHKRTEA